MFASWRASILRVKSKYLTNKLGIIYVLSALKAFFSILNAVLAVKILGVVGYGEFVSAMAAMGLIRSLVETRNSEAVAFFLSRRKISVITLSKIAFLVDLISALLLIFGASFFIELLSRFSFFSNFSTLKEIISVVVLIGASQLLRGVCVGFCMYLRRVDLSSLIAVLEEMLRLFCVLILFYWLDFEGVFTFGLAYSIAGGVSTVIIIIILFPLIKDTHREGLDINLDGKWSEIKDYVGYIFNAFFATLIKAFHSRLDVIFMTGGFGFAASGVLDLVKKAAAPLSFVMGPLAAYTFRGLSDSKADLNIFSNNIRKSAYSSLLFCFLYAALTSYPLLIFKDQYGLPLYFDDRSILAIYWGACLATTMWWARNFSNLTTQLFSIVGNLLALVYMAFIAGAASHSEDIWLYSLALFGCNFMLVVYWLVVVFFRELMLSSWNKGT